jgi:hypothetical protein
LRRQQRPKALSLSRSVEFTHAGNMFLGSLYDAERLAKANPFGIGAVVSLSATGPCNTRCEITYIHLHVEDGQAIPVAQSDAIVGSIAENFQCGRLLIHCGSGISRAPELRGG